MRVRKKKTHLPIKHGCKSHYFLGHQEIPTHITVITNNRRIFFIKSWENLTNMECPLNREKQSALCDAWFHNSLSVRNGRRGTKRVAELLKAHRNQSKKDAVLASNK
ncbi:hypothetical protein ACB094_03G188200 [Castanea mollissima]